MVEGAVGKGGGGGGGVRALSDCTLRAAPAASASCVKMSPIEPKLSKSASM